MNHELKIWPHFFARVEDGSKTFEVRDDDRGFQHGDTVTLREWDPQLARQIIDKGTPVEEAVWEPIGYSGKSLNFKVGYVLPLEDKRAVFSLLKHAEKDFHPKKEIK